MRDDGLWTRDEERGMTDIIRMWDAGCVMKYI